MQWTPSARSGRCRFRPGEVGRGAHDPLGASQRHGSGGPRSLRLLDAAKSLDRQLDFCRRRCGYSSSWPGRIRGAGNGTGQQDRARMSPVAESAGSLAVASRTDESVAVLTVDGVLDAANCVALRDRILKATFDDASAVIVNVSALKVHAALTWSAFMGVYWQVRSSPHIPIILVCTNRTTRE